MSIYRLKPVYKDYLWGGTKLKENYNKNSNKEIIAESWELSTHPDGTSLIVDKDGSEIKLTDFIKRKGKEILGRNVQRFEDFPILVKLIDANDALSIQVHPDEEYAKEHEHQHGKTEMWIVLEANDSSYIYFGPKRKLNKEEFIEAIEDNTLTNLLNKIKVKRGDVFYVKPGTIHAIGKNCLIAEIQQNSNVTYRIYDYNRKGTDGKPRELHLKQALEVSNLNPAQLEYDFKGHTGLSNTFVVDTLDINETPVNRVSDESSFTYYLVSEGNGSISSNEEKLDLNTGDSVFITAGTGDIELDGKFKIIEVKVPSEDLLKD